MTVHVGEYMAMLVTSYLVYHKTHSVVATGLILLCFNVPSLALASVATSLTRRFGALKVDAWVNTAEGAIALVPMALAFTHHLSVVALLLWVVGYGVCEVLNAPDSYLVRQLIAEPGKLPEFNSAYTRNVAVAARRTDAGRGHFRPVWTRVGLLGVCRHRHPRASSLRRNLPVPARH